MTREEAIKRLKEFKILHTEQHGWDVSTLKALDMAIKALEQNPKYRKEAKRWKNKALEQQPCEDAVSRAKAIEICKSRGHDNSAHYISELPSVTPQQKTGHWIEDAKTYYEELNKRGLSVDEYTPYFTDDIACSECLAKYSMLDNETQFFKCCPNCGKKMAESEEKE